MWHSRQGPTDSAAGSRKRKRDTDDEAGILTGKFTSDGEDLEDGEIQGLEDEDDEEDYSAPKYKTMKSGKQPAAAGASKGKPKTSTVKKPRVPKTKGATGARKGKTDASMDVAKQIKDSHVSDDNALFSMCSSRDSSSLTRLFRLHLEPFRRTTIHC
jgi:cohesin complex subunit SA-1/2